LFYRGKVWAQERHFTCSRTAKRTARITPNSPIQRRKGFHTLSILLNWGNILKACPQVFAFRGFIRRGGFLGAAFAINIIDKYIESEYTKLKDN
jgi:hypothetical protein